MNYRIFEGYDHFNGTPLYQVIGSDNDYVGEWHTSEQQAKNSFFFWVAQERLKK
jgi:hypothetical protein